MTVSGVTVPRETGADRGDDALVWTPAVLLAIGLGYAVGFMITTLAAGPWQAVRSFAAEGLILILWLLVSRRLLKDQPFLEAPVRKPNFELVVGLFALAVQIGSAALYYLVYQWPILVTIALIYSIPLLILTKQTDRHLALGLCWAPGRAWLALLAITVINILVGLALGNLLPPGELPTPPGADLAEGLSSPWQVAAMFVQLTLIAAIPEELFFRVFLQPRLSRFLPVGWAILVQALLFSAAHLPQGLIRYGESWPLALAGLFTVANGLIGGYLWRRSRSLPLLVILHLFAYPRIGL